MKVLTYLNHLIEALLRLALFFYCVFNVIEELKVLFVWSLKECQDFGWIHFIFMEQLIMNECAFVNEYSIEHHEIESGFK